MVFGEEEDRLRGSPRVDGHGLVVPSPASQLGHVRRGVVLPRRIRIHLPALRGVIVGCRECRRER